MTETVWPEAMVTTALGPLTSTVSFAPGTPLVQLTHVDATFHAPPVSDAVHV
jgi:hypothetical protein